MKTLGRMAVVALLVMLSCHPYSMPPKLYPDNPTVIIEAIRLYMGKLYVVKSEILPGEYYWESSTKVQRRKRVWLEIYVAEEHKIKLYMVVPAKMRKAQPETWRFPPFKEDK